MKLKEVCMIIKNVWGSEMIMIIQEVWYFHVLLLIFTGWAIVPPTPKKTNNLIFCKPSIANSA